MNGVISFDLKKAFNTIDYVVLFVKLSWYGVLENGLKWFTSYLTGGKQLFYVNGILSSFKCANCGVSQRSCLGPLLFLSYINKNKNATPSIFADDTEIMAVSDSFPQLKNLIE